MLSFSHVVYVEFMFIYYSSISYSANKIHSLYYSHTHCLHMIMTSLKEEQKLLWRKVTIVGPTGVGKTSLIKQFCEGKFTAQSYPTVGADYGHKHCQIGNQEVEVTFWDLAGSIEFKEIRRQLLPDTELCLLVFDALSLSVELVMEWIHEVTQYVTSDKIAIFINKMDLVEKKKSVHDRITQVKELASKHNISVSLTTAKPKSEVKDAIISLLLQTLPDTHTTQ